MPGVRSRKASPFRLPYRERLYGCTSRRTDALFKLADAILTAIMVPSPVRLSLEGAYRRGWGSPYAALRGGEIDEEALRNLLARYPLNDDARRDHPPVYAMDVSSWPRCDAEAGPERGYCYHPSRHSAGQPIVAGWAYQLIAEKGFARDTWVAPVDARRVHLREDDNDVAAEQVRDLLDRLPQKDILPMFVFDAGYDPVKLQRGLEDYDAQLLVRLHSNRVSMILKPGPSPQPSIAAKATPTARCGSGPGQSYIRRPAAQASATVARERQW